MYISCVDILEHVMTLGKSGGRPLRDTTINLRTRLDQRSLIDKAANVLGKSRSDFMLEAACREAESVLLDRRYFALDGKTFERFRQELERPPGGNVRLRRALTTKAPWE